MLQKQKSLYCLIYFLCLNLNRVKNARRHSCTKGHFFARKLKNKKKLIIKKQKRIYKLRKKNKKKVTDRG